jgi:hypothetical protein
MSGIPFAYRIGTRTPIMSRFNQNPEPTPGQRARSDRLTIVFQAIEGAIHENLKGESREKSLALTALEESFAWAQKSISKEEIE